MDEVWAEYTADVGTKKGEKVDYAIFKDGSPAILFECKTAGVDLVSSHANQLHRYFQNVHAARFGVLTNGIAYRFFCDIEKPNIMDSKPFLEFDLLDIQEPLVEELEKFTKAKFDDTILVSELKYTREIKHLLAAEYESPKKEFVCFFLDNVIFRSKTKKAIEQFTPITKRAFHEFVNEAKPDNPIGEAKYQPTKETTVQPPPPVIDEQGWQPLSALNPPKDGSRPISISFPDNSTVSIKYWRDIMIEVVRWLIDNNILNTSHSPIRPTSRGPRYSVSTKPIHSNNKSFTAPYTIGTFYLETHESGLIIVSKVEHIIQHFGQDPAQFKVRFP